MEKVLIVLAAGMATRFGSLKQLKVVAPHAQTLLDFSLFDAIKAGFDTVVFIIKPEIEAEFEAKIASRMRPFIKVKYAYQENANLPIKVDLPEDRLKPLGTAHALYCARDCVAAGAKIAVINADDYYGQAAYQSLITYWQNQKATNEYATVAYKLVNTLSKEGSVSRGVLSVDQQAYLQQIAERTQIKWLDAGQEIVAGELDEHAPIAFTEDNGASWQALKAETPVSMNIWAFDTSIFTLCEQELRSFLEQDLKANPLKAECYLPVVVDKAIKCGQKKVKVLFGDNQWFGLTYQADQQKVQQELAKLIAAGVYPEALWEANNFVTA